WAAVRKIGKPGTDTSSAGLVPKSYLKAESPIFRGYALYTYESDSPECVEVYLGQKLSVYATLGEWVVVKLDGYGESAGDIPYLLKSYIKRFDDASNVDPWMISSILRLI
ncbi:hypothetical protein FRC01_005213, partial [Tulasnella sp. 417]